MGSNVAIPTTPSGLSSAMTDVYTVRNARSSSSHPAVTVLMRRGGVDVDADAFRCRCRTDDSSFVSLPTTVSMMGNYDDDDDDAECV